jgi:energy-coupling factor transporter ATP-binding protein EcfA2
MAERQRVAIARALVRTPSIVIADEPTCHQDAEHARAIAQVIAEIAQEGASVLIASRDPGLWAAAARHRWRTLALRDAQLVEAGAPLTLDPAREPSTEVVLETDVVESGPAEGVPNVLPFPITARSRGAG